MEIIIAGLTMLGTLIPAYLKYRSERKKFKEELEILQVENQKIKIKLSYFDRIMELESINSIKLAVNEIFNETTATRFLILIAVNGKTDFNTASVIFEQMKDGFGNISAIARYHNIQVDDEYRKMLKLSETNGHVEFKIAEMENCLFKNIYTSEGIKYAKVIHLFRKSIDRDNDLLVYSNVSTHTDEEFTNTEKSTIKVIFDSQIRPNINKVLS